MSQHRRPRQPSNVWQRVVPLMPTEHDEQAALVTWAALLAKQEVPALCLLYANANGGKRSKATAGKMKAEGVKAGVPDLFLAVARHGYHGLYIEMKTTRGRLSDDQKHWDEMLRGQGFRVEMCRGQDPAKELLLAYLADGLVRWKHWLSFAGRMKLDGVVDE